MFSKEWFDSFCSNSARGHANLNSHHPSYRTAGHPCQQRGLAGGAGGRGRDGRRRRRRRRPAGDPGQRAAGRAEGGGGAAGGRHAGGPAGAAVHPHTDPHVHCQRPDGKWERRIWCISVIIRHQSAKILERAGSNQSCQNGIMFIWSLFQGTKCSDKHCLHMELVRH